MRRRLFLICAGAIASIALSACGEHDTEQAEPEAPAAQAPAIEDAFYYAFPLYEFARTEQDRTGAVGQVGRLNMLAHRAQLMDHTSRQVTAPNNDTIYSSAFLELSGGPVEIIAPSSAERYYSIAFMDAFTDNFAYIGTRATDGEGGRFWIVGPEWSGESPEGVEVVQSTTNDVWMLMRALVDGPEDLAAAQAFQSQLSVKVAGDRPPPKPYETAAGDVTDPENFLALVNEMLRRSPGAEGETARAEQFTAWGIGADAPAPSAELLDEWRAYIPQGIEELRQTFLFRDLVRDGWSYQPRGIGDFGENDMLRAAVALGGLAALGEEEAMYFHANFGAGGERLTGDKPYRWRVPAGGVPADAFWSLTMYRAMPDGRYFLVENPINRFAIGDRTPDLIVEPDGSFEILIQQERPEGEMAANWLPAPEGPMRLALRAYLPRQELQDREWVVPALEEQ